MKRSVCVTMDGGRTTIALVDVSGWLGRRGKRKVLLIQVRLFFCCVYSSSLQTWDYDIKLVVKEKDEIFQLP